MSPGITKGPLWGRRDKITHFKNHCFIQYPTNTQLYLQFPRQSCFPTPQRIYSLTFRACFFPSKASCTSKLTQQTLWLSATAWRNTTEGLWLHKPGLLSCFRPFPVTLSTPLDSSPLSKSKASSTYTPFVRS